MLQALANALQRPHGASPQDAKQHREDFRRHMMQDSGEVVNKLLHTMSTDVRGVLEEVVDQTHQFWTNQIHRVEEAHRVSLAAAQQQLSQANEKHEEVVKTYTQVIDSLNSQLADVHTRLEEQKHREQATVEGLRSQLAGVEHTLEETTRTYKGVIQDLNKQLVAAQAALREAELKGQQKRMVLGQTMDVQRKETEDLRAELRKMREQLEASEARNKKLTAVSQHLLQKHHQLRAAASTSSSGGEVPASGAEDIDGAKGAAAEVVAGSSSGTVSPSPVKGSINASRPSPAAEEDPVTSPTKELLQLVSPCDEVLPGALDKGSTQGDTPGK